MWKVSRLCAKYIHLYFYTFVMLHLGPSLWRILKMIFSHFFYYYVNAQWESLLFVFNEWTFAVTPHAHSHVSGRITFTVNSCEQCQQKSLEKGLCRQQYASQPTWLTFHWTVWVLLGLIEIQTRILNVDPS